MKYCAARYSLQQCTRGNAAASVPHTNIPACNSGGGGAVAEWAWCCLAELGGTHPMARAVLRLQPLGSHHQPPEGLQTSANTQQHTA